MQQAHELGRLLEGMLCHVNVIPLNPTEGFGGEPTGRRGVDAFARILGDFGVRVWRACVRTRAIVVCCANFGPPLPPLLLLLLLLLQ